MNDMEEQAQAARGPSIETVSERAAFVALGDAWDSLAAKTGHDGPFFQHAFIRNWLDDFAPDVPWRILIERDPDGTLAAALPLVERRTRLLGVPVRELSAAANPHSCRFDWLARRPEASADALLAELEAQGGWDVLRLVDAPEGGAAFTLMERARAAGYPTGTWESLRSPYIPLPDTADALFSGLSSKFRANLRRRRRKLEEKGRIDVEWFRGGPELEAKLEEGFGLEASGWKGTRGTAIAQDGATRGFYSELAREASARGELRLAFLRLDGRPVAFHFALCRAGVYALLKPGYDESLGDCSPGQLLMEEVLRGCVEEKLREFDFLGPDMTWKRDWTDRVRVHTWLYVFRRSRFGRALCEAKFRWAPRAKEVVATWRRR